MISTLPARLRVKGVKLLLRGVYVAEGELVLRDEQVGEAVGGFGVGSRIPLRGHDPAGAGMGVGVGEFRGDLRLCFHPFHHCFV